MCIYTWSARAHVYIYSRADSREQLCIYIYTCTRLHARAASVANDERTELYTATSRAISSAERRIGRASFLSPCLFPPRRSSVSPSICVCGSLSPRLSLHSRGNDKEEDPPRISLGRVLLLFLAAIYIYVSRRWYRLDFRGILWRTESRPDGPGSKAAAKENRCRALAGNAPVIELAVARRLYIYPIGVYEKNGRFWPFR